MPRSGLVPSSRRKTYSISPLEDSIPIHSRLLPQPRPGKRPSSQWCGRNPRRNTTTSGHQRQRKAARRRGWGCCIHERRWQLQHGSGPPSSAHRSVVPCGSFASSLQSPFRAAPHLRLNPTAIGHGGLQFASGGYLLAGSHVTLL